MTVDVRGFRLTKDIPKGMVYLDYLGATKAALTIEEWSWLLANADVIKPEEPNEASDAGDVDGPCDVA